MSMMWKKLYKPDDLSGAIPEEEEEFFVDSQMFKVENVSLNPEANYTIYVEAPNGSVPSNVVGVSCDIMNTANYVSAITNTFGESMTPLLSFNIYMNDAQRNAVDLTGTVTVRIEYLTLANISTPMVLHALSDGTYEVLSASVSAANQIQFTTRSMSVFTVVDLAAASNWDSFTVDNTASVLVSAYASGVPISVEYNGEIYQATKISGALGEYVNGLNKLTLILPQSGTTAYGYLSQILNVHEIPAGGTAGQVLKKINANDYAVEWASDNDHIPIGGSSGQVLKKASNNNYDVYWGNEAGGAGGNGLPSGGSTGQVLAKATDDDYNVIWVNQSGGGGTTEVVWFTYGTSTNSDIETAYQAGKICAVAYGNRVYFLTSRASSTDHLFIATILSTIYRVECSADTWTNTSKSVVSASSTTPSPLGTAAVGTGTTYARADHVHEMPSASDVGAYALPSGGIPATDLASAVQTSLGKADTALQSAPVTSVNSQTGAVVLSIPSTAADVGAAPAITEVTVSTAGAVTQALDAGKLYHFTGALTALTITLNAAGTGVIPQYHFDFDCSSTAPTVTIPNTVTMPSGNTFDASTHYEVDILNGYGVVSAWATS